MIWTWLKAALIFLAKLIIPGPPVARDPKIDPNAKCPSCGARDGDIRAITTEGKPPSVRHTCHVCFAQWFEAPILNTSKLTAKPEAISKVA